MKEKVFHQTHKKKVSPENSMQYHHGCGVLEFVVIQKCALNFSCDMLLFES